MKRLAIIFGFLSLVLTGWSQAVWTSVEAKGEISKRLSVSAEGEYRTTDQLRDTKRWNIGLGADYKIAKWLKAGVAVTFIDQRVGLSTTKKGNLIPAYWQPKYRWQAGLTGKYSVGRFTLSLREQLQVTYRTSQWVSKYSSSGKQKDDEYVAFRTKSKLRSRLGVEYNIRRCPLEPYANVELYNSLNDGMAKDKLRLTIGSDVKFNKHNTFTLYYRYIDHSDDDDGAGHILGIGYTYKFGF